MFGFLKSFLGALGADAGLLSPMAKAIVTGWNSKKFTLQELKDHPTGTKRISTYPYPSSWSFQLRSGYEKGSAPTKWTSKVINAIRSGGLEPVQRSHSETGATDGWHGYLRMSSDFRIAKEQAINYITQAQAESQEKLALEKQITELKLSQELAQAEVTEARLKSQQLRDQLQNAILQAQLKQEELNLQKVMSEKKEEEKMKEAEAKKKKNIRNAGIATAVATGAYFLMS